MRAPNHPGAAATESADLQLHGAKVQRLSAAERDNAHQIKAVRIPDDEPSRAARSAAGRARGVDRRRGAGAKRSRTATPRNSVV